jgi:deazaflavin-dependent oxidoreductase (nitroreductase family)
MTVAPQWPSARVRRVQGEAEHVAILRRLGSAPPAGLTRLLARAPLWLYRFHLGRLLGHHALVLTHRGRKSGKARQAILEVVHYDPATRESVVFAGWRGDTDWYRNLQAHPALRVQTAGTSYVPVQRFLSPEETARDLAAYVARYPWLARQALARVFGLSLDDAPDGMTRAAAFFRGVAFRPADDTPAG